jgi:hypothetical protein
MSTPRFAVYHALDPLMMAHPQAAHWQTDRDAHYTHVADVEASFEQVFALTNHGDLAHYRYATEINLGWRCHRGL